MLQKTLGRILGCALLSYGSTALAFTLITIPPSLTPSDTVTTPITLQTQAQPIAGTIRAQIFGLRRPGSSNKVTQVGGGMSLATTSRAGSGGGGNYLAAYPSAYGGEIGGGKSVDGWIRPETNPLENTVRAVRTAYSSDSGSEIGGGNREDVRISSATNSLEYLFLRTAPSASDGGTGGGNTESLWISTTTDSLKNDFYRTAFYGATENILVGFDFTRSDRFVVGISGGYEASNYVTEFNSGDQKTRGYNINPYFAWLMSNSWSLDLIGGYGTFSTDQSRTLSSGTPGVPTVVGSSFSSSRSFASTNLTNISAFGNWKLTGSLGYLWSKRDQDAYTENGGFAVAGSNQTSKQWNLLGEVAYGRGNSEGFFGARYEDILDYQKVQLTAGVGDQPANDPTSVLLTAGWRYFGKGLTASFVFSTRVAQEQVRQNGFSMVLRADL